MNAPFHRKSSSSSISGIYIPDYLQSRPVLDRLYPDFEIDKAEINDIADHITAFSLAAITEMTCR
jgi:hypothetical protein